MKPGAFDRAKDSSDGTMGSVHGRPGNRQGPGEKNEFGAVPSDARIEAGNDVAQTMIDAAYGYRNFERFRKRFLLMRWNAKR